MALENLDLACNKIRKVNFSILSQLPALECVNFNNNKIKEVDNLTKINSKTEIDIEDNRISDEEMFCTVCKKY